MFILYIYKHIYAYIPTTRLCYAQLYLRTWTHTRSHTSAHTPARAHRRSPPRTTARAALTTRPSASRPRWRAARAGKAAHTQCNVVTDAVFHAPMFALNAHAVRNACEPSHPRSTPAGRRSHVSARMRGRPIAHHTRARTGAARGRACAAGAHWRFVHRGSQTRMDIDTCMHCVHIYCVCACSIDGWPDEESASHSHTCRAFAHRQRPHAIARDRTRMQEHTRVPIHIPGLGIDICTHILYMTCTLAIYTGGCTRACARDGDGRIVGARNRTHVCIACGAATCTPMPISHTSAHIPTYICIMHTYRYIYMYIRMNTYIHTYI
jgi:hypothetical protein